MTVPASLPEATPDAMGGQDRILLLRLLPNIVTLLGLCAGLTALRLAYAGRFEAAAALIIFAAVIDGLDGLLAKKLDVASTFGAELDSLSDFVNFGVAPALIVYHGALAGAPDVSWTAALIFAVCACLRLARFNVGRTRPVVGKACFVGVPAPAGAMLGLLPMFLTFAGVADSAAHPWLISGWLAFVGLLMVCRLPTFAPKSLRISRSVARWLLVGVPLLIGLALSRFWGLMLLLDAAYLGVLAWTAIAHLRRRRVPVEE
jgi:CDP-diacylglycerol--serine O-phosphatidyltransferase